MAMCPRCKFVYREPEGEEGEHECPRCGGWKSDHMPGCPGGNCDCDGDYDEREET
jgi:rubredoxin